MKKKTANNSPEKKAVAKEYVDTQLETIKKFGSDVQLSNANYTKIIQRIARATS